MKRIALLLSAVFVILLASCQKDDLSWQGEIADIKSELANQKKLIEALQNDARIVSITQGTDSYTIKFTNGQSITLTNGKTPVMSIGDNGNWFINGEDTGKASRGQDGTNGEDGKDGENGADGHTPSIEIKNGTWWIEGEDTGIRAQAQDGNDGSNAPRIVSIVDHYTFMEFVFDDGSIISSPKTGYKCISSERYNKVLVTDASVVGKDNYIRKDTYISCLIECDKDLHILLGRGRTTYEGYFLEIDNEDLTLHHYVTSDEIVKSYKHNLNITDRLFVSIDHSDGTTATVTLQAGGVEKKWNLTWWAGGAVFATNLGTSPVAVDLSFFPKRTDNSVWIIGDSYVNWTKETRWPYYMCQYGFSNWLADHQPGAGSGIMLASFRNDIMYGHPVYALWMIGMNDKNDTDGEPFSYWLKNTNEFISLCEANGIIPILSTIPTTPHRTHNGKTAWVRSSGYRYIDVAAAVDPDDDGQWLDGMLETDNVHPTALGAQAIAQRVLVDFPEITYK